MWTMIQKTMKVCDTRTFDAISPKGASDMWAAIHLDGLFQGCHITTAKRLSVDKIKFVELQSCENPCNLVWGFDS